MVLFCCRVSDFEFTPECIVFDLLSIGLFHGWLIDPQNTHTISAVGPLSYNQLVETIIASKQDGADSQLQSEGKHLISFMHMLSVGDVVAQWLVRQTTDLKVESLSPGRCIHVVSPGRTLNSHSGSLHLGLQMGTSNLLADNPTKILGGNLRWTSIPSRGSRNMASPFILQKPEISASLMGLLARPITIGGRLYLLHMLSVLHVTLCVLVIKK